MKYVYGIVTLAVLTATLGRSMVVAHLRLAIRRHERRTQN